MMELFRESNGFRLFTSFAKKRSIIDVWQGSKRASDLFK